MRRLFFLPAQTAASNAAVFSWNNAAGGNWNVASDWSSGTVPLSPGQALTEPAGNTISGFGTINAALINQGLVNANVNGQTLTLATNPMTNTGTMETSNSGVLDIATSLNNSGGTIQSSGGGSIQITSGTLSNTGGTIQATGGSNLQITNATVNNTAGGTLLASGGTSLQITNATVNSTSAARSWPPA